MGMEMDIYCPRGSTHDPTKTGNHTEGENLEEKTTAKLEVKLENISTATEKRYTWFKSEFKENKMEPHNMTDDAMTIWIPYDNKKGVKDEMGSKILPIQQYT